MRGTTSGRRRPGRHLRRDRRLIAASLAVGLGAAGVVGAQLAFAAPPADPVVTADVGQPADGTLDLGFTGDTMLGDGSQARLDAEGPGPLLSGVAPLLADYDYTMINAEVPFTTSQTPNNPGAKYSYASDPAYLASLQDIGVDAVNLGNNHAMDRGPIGLADSMRHAADLDVESFGAGKDRAEAERPLIIRSGDLDVAVVSFGENFGPLHRSTDVGPGMVPLKEDRIERAIRVANDHGVDRVVAFLHWGDNYSDVNPQQEYWAQVFADAGYDAVIGSGSHTLQSVDVIDGMPVVYGMGNFVFGAPGRFAGYGKLGLGAVVGLRWEANGTGVITMNVIQTDNLLVDYVARPVPEPELGPAKEIIGDKVTWTGDTATLRF